MTGEHDPIAPYDGALPHLNGEEIARELQIPRKGSG
jgi:hypothetical protein